MRNHAPVVAFLWVLLAGCDAATVPSASLVPTSPTPAMGCDPEPHHAGSRDAAPDTTPNSTVGTAAAFGSRLLL